MRFVAQTIREQKMQYHGTGKGKGKNKAVDKTAAKRWHEVRKATATRSGSFGLLTVWMR